MIQQITNSTQKPFYPPCGGVSRIRVRKALSPIIFYWSEPCAEPGVVGYFGSTRSLYPCGTQYVWPYWVAHCSGGMQSHSTSHGIPAACTLLMFCREPMLPHTATLPPPSIRQTRRKFPLLRRTPPSSSPISLNVMIMLTYPLIGLCHAAHSAFRSSLSNSAKTSSTFQSETPPPGNNDENQERETGEHSGVTVVEGEEMNEDCARHRAC